MGKAVELSKRKQTVGEHFRELRRRFFACVGIFVSFAVAIYFFYEPIVKILSGSLGSELYYSNPAGGFAFILRICTTGAIIFTIPFIFYNVIKFAKPAFEKVLTTKRIISVSIFSIILALIGAAFAYFLILPESIHFFGDFNVGGLSALINADEYLTFVTSMIAAFAAIFQVPLLMLFIDSVKPIPPQKLFKNEFWVVVISIVVAIITPFNYDVMSSLIVAIPIIGLYNLSIVLILFKNLMTKGSLSVNQKSTVIKPVINGDFYLTDDEFIKIRDDIINFELESPIDPGFNVANQTNIDFKVKAIRNSQLDKAAWLKAKQARIVQINSNKRVFSDIMPRRTNRVLASQ